MKKEDQSRSLFGISLTDRPKWQQFLICSSGFFFGYLVNGICEEYVYNRLQFSYGWYFTFIQGFVYLALIHMQGFTTKQMVNPWKTYVKLSAVLMGSHGLTKGSLAFLNYPAQIMFKSTKVLPVMIMGAFIPGLRRKYPLHEYISAVLLVVGLILFTLADAQTSPNFSMAGVIMISGALIMDSFLGNLQEAIFTMNPETTQMEMLFCSTIVGFPFLLVPMIVTGELFTAWTSCYQHPYVYGVLIFEAMATFIGQVSVLSLIALFGAATTALITTARKAVTLLLSYFIFTKPLTEQHGTGLLFIVMGIILKMLPDNKLPTYSSVTNAARQGISMLKDDKAAVQSGKDSENEDEENRPLDRKDECFVMITLTKINVIGRVHLEFVASHFVMKVKSKVDVEVEEEGNYFQFKLSLSSEVIFSMSLIQYMVLLKWNTQQLCDKRSIEGSRLEGYSTVSSLQQRMHRAESSQLHVRALNNQFASAAKGYTFPAAESQLAKIKLVVEVRSNNAKIFQEKNIFGKKFLRIQVLSASTGTSLATCWSCDKETPGNSVVKEELRF
ncbi:hypothetical protein ACFE04_016151 [Oxalis oulophora]